MPDARVTGLPGFVWDGVRWVPGLQGCAIVSTSPPLNPTPGVIWHNPDNAVTMLWDATGWIVIGGGAPGARVWVGTEPPEDTEAYPLWFNPEATAVVEAPRWDTPGLRWDETDLRWDAAGGGGDGATYGVLSVWDGEMWNPVQGAPGPPGPPGGGLTLEEAEQIFATQSYVNDRVTGALSFIGTYDARTNQVEYTATSGFTGTAIVPAGQAKDSYLVVSYSGTPSAGPFAGTPLFSTEWLISDGEEWTAIQHDEIAEMLASGVAVNPVILGQDNVQSALQSIEIALADLSGGDIGQIYASSVNLSASILGTGNVQDALEALDTALAEVSGGQIGEIWASAVHIDPLAYLPGATNVQAALAAMQGWVENEILNAGLGGGDITIEFPISITQGGTHAMTAPQARENLGIAPATVNGPFLSLATTTAQQLAGPLVLSGPPGDAAPLNQAVTMGWVGDRITGALHFIGTYNAATNQANYTASSGFTGTAVVAATQAVDAYLIVSVAGTPPPPPAAPPGIGGVSLFATEWLISDGTAWNAVQHDQIVMEASEITVTPALAFLGNPDNVQLALTAIPGFVDAQIADALAGLGPINGDGAIQSIGVSGGLTITGGSGPYAAIGLPNAAGDLTGTWPTITTAGLRGRVLPTAAPTDRQAYVFSGGAWGLQSTVAEAPNDTFVYARRGSDNSWQGLTRANGNVALGENTLAVNIGHLNLGIGNNALAANTSGQMSVALGASSLSNQTTGGDNVGVGQSTLYANQTGARNVAIGSAAAQRVTGSGNTAVGSSALSLVLRTDTLPANTGDNNVAIGRDALDMATGSDNVTIGAAVARFFGGAAGGADLTGINASVLIGANAHPQGNNQTNQIVIGANALGNGSNTVTLGSNAITGVFVGNTQIWPGGGDGVTSLTDLLTGTPTAGQVPQWDGTNWVPWTPPAAGGGGTVTGVTAGTGLQVGAGPGGTISTSGTLNLTDTGVAATSYTNANITVDPQGRITAASSGSPGVSGDFLPLSGGTLQNNTAGFFNPILNLRGGDGSTIRFQPLTTTVTAGQDTPYWDVVSNRMWWGVQTPASQPDGDGTGAWFGMDSTTNRPWFGMGGGLGAWDWGGGNVERGYSVQFNLRGALEISQAPGSTDFGHVLDMYTPNERACNFRMNRQGSAYWDVDVANQAMNFIPWSWSIGGWNVASMTLAEMTENGGPRNNSWRAFLVDPLVDPGWWQNPQTGAWQANPAFRVLNNWTRDVATFEAPWNDQCNVRLTAPNSCAYLLVAQGRGNGQNPSAQTGEFWLWREDREILPFWVRNNGDVYVASGQVVGVSDPRTKEILGSYEAGLTEILELNPIRYRYNGKAYSPKDDETVVRVGINGFDIEKVMRETTSRVVRKLDPNDESETDVLNVNSGPVLWALVNAVKELKAELDELKATRH